MEKKNIVKSKVRKYPVICDILMGFCAVYLVAALFVLETERWIETENKAKVIFYFAAIIFGFYSCTKRLITYRVIEVDEKDFTVSCPFKFKSKTYLKKDIREVTFDDENLGKKSFIDIEIIMNNGEKIIISNREFKNFGELVKAFNSKIQTAKIKKLEKFL